jgi:DNA primase
MDSISQIKQNLDIVDVINSYVPIKKSGKNYKGCCPFHSEKTPSFMVSQDLQIFKCFGCGEGGDMFKFVELMEGVDFPQALEILAEKAGVVLEKKDFDKESQLKKRIYYINDITAKFYNYILTRHSLGKPGLDYFKQKRFLQDTTINEFVLGYAPDTGKVLFDFLIKKGFNEQELLTAGVIVEKFYDGARHLVDKFRGRVIFPLTGIDGKVEGFSGRTVLDRDPKYLNTSETPVFYKSINLFPLDKAKTYIKKEGAVFVEGPMDALSAHQAGFKNVVASSGTSLTTGQLKVVSRYTNNVTFCFDNDTAGINAAKRAVDLAEKLNFNIRVALIPAGSKDLDELVRKDPSLVKELFDNAVSAYDFFLGDSLRRYDRTSAMGKKSVMDELVGVFGKIQSPVLLDHYVKKISQELDLSHDTVYNAIVRQEGFKPEESVLQETGEDSIQKLGPDAYFLAVLLHLPLDTIGNFLYKLRSEDFEDLSVRSITTSLSTYLEKGNSATLADFKMTLTPQLQNSFDNLYLMDIPVDDAPQLDRLIQNAFSRVKMLSTKRQLEALSVKIKEAEMTGDSENLKKLSEEFRIKTQELLSLNSNI